MNVLRALLACALLITPSIALAAPRTLSQLANQVANLLNVTTGVLMVAGIAIYFWGISINILKFGEDREKFRNYFLWGIIVLFVMVSIWGIVYLIQGTLFGGSASGPGPTQQTQGAPQVIDI